MIFFVEYLRILGTKNTSGGHTTVGGNDTYGITGIPTTVGGRGVVETAGLSANTQIVYPGLGHEDV